MKYSDSKKSKISENLKIYVTESGQVHIPLVTSDNQITHEGELLLEATAQIINKREPSLFKSIKSSLTDKIIYKNALTKKLTLEEKKILDSIALSVSTRTLNKQEELPKAIEYAKLAQKQNNKDHCTRA